MVILCHWPSRQLNHQSCHHDSFGAKLHPTMITRLFAFCCNYRVFHSCNKNSRTDQRGAAIFMVLLVIVILSSLGLYSAYIAGLNQRISGYGWQSTLSEYAADLGTLTVANDLATGAGSAYMQLVLQGAETCSANKFIIQENNNPVACYRVTKSDIVNRLTTGAEAPKLFDPASTSVGGQQLTGDFMIELTDPSPSSKPVPGMDQGGTGPRFRYMLLTLTGTGTVRPLAQNSVDVISSSAAIRTNRAVVNVGPLPY